MIGNMIVRFMNLILNAVAVLIIISATIAGGMLASEANLNSIVGAIIGLILGFLFTVITCGIAFLALEINNNLIRIKETLKSK